jgi:hypothetical protein
MRLAFDFDAVVFGDEVQDGVEFRDIPPVLVVVRHGT